MKYVTSERRVNLNVPGGDLYVSTFCAQTSPHVGINTNPHHACLGPVVLTVLVSSGSAYQN